MKPVGVLVMAHGTPHSLDDLPAFYTEIRRGSPPPPELLADLERRYLAIGGTSPLNERTDAQVEGIRRALARRAPGRFRVAAGAKFAPPRIADAVETLGHAGVDRLIGLVLAPHFSVASVGDYERRARAAADALGPDEGGPLDLEMIDHWHLAPGLVPLMATRVRDAVMSLPAEARPDAAVVFTAHSIPARLVDAGDPYPAQVHESATAIAEAAGIARWSVAWQSAGRTADAWLEPDVRDRHRRAPRFRRLGRGGVPGGFRVGPPRGPLRRRHRGARRGTRRRHAVRSHGVAQRRPRLLRRARRCRARRGRGGARLTMSGAASQGTVAPGNARPTVAIVGGGIAGLSAAWELACTAPGVHVVVLEADERLGGKLRTGAIGGRDVDLGPDAFLARRPEAVALCRELGLGDELVCARQPHRLRVGPGAAPPAPRRPGAGCAHPPGAPGPVGHRLAAWERRAPRSTSWGGRPRRGAGQQPRSTRGRHHPTTPRARSDRAAGRSPHRGHPRRGHDPDERRRGVPCPARGRLGGGSLMRALRSSPSSSPPAVGGPVTGVDGEPPVFYAVRGGLSRLVERLAEALGARGVDVRVAAPVGHLELRRHDGALDRGRTRGRVGSCTPPGAPWRPTPWSSPPRRGGRRSFSSRSTPPVAAMLAAIDYADVTLVTLQLPAHGVGNPLEGTGFLVPADHGLPHHGVHVAHLEVARAPSPRRRLAACLDGPLR